MKSGTSVSHFLVFLPTLTSEIVGFAFILPFPGPGESISMFWLSGCPWQNSCKRPEIYPKQK